MPHEALQVLSPPGVTSRGRTLRKKETAFAWALIHHPRGHRRVFRTTFHRLRHDGHRRSAGRPAPGLHRPLLPEVHHRRIALRSSERMRFGFSQGL